MAEPAARHYPKLIKPLFDAPAEDPILQGHVITCNGNEVIEQSFVEFEKGKLIAMGTTAELAIH